MLATFSVSAQVNGFQLPYNPDSEPDGYIGIGDVLELLTNFGDEWISSDIYVDADSVHILLDVGDLSYPECAFSCQHTLPGSWRMATITDAGAAFNAVRGSQAWINPEGYLWEKNTYGDVIRFFWNTNGTIGEAYDFDILKGCFCATQERPKVEYSFCEGTDDFEPCVTTKVGEGWYPLQGTSMISYNGKHKYQAFWRWAE